VAQLALGAVGAAVGFVVGGPAGAAIGWSLGSVAGGALFAPKTNQVGPRLTEYRITESSYGAPLPRIYGGARLGAQVIWAGDVYERENRKQVSKRGYVTEYRYEQSFALAVCAGPIQAIRRVWFDHKLVYSSEITDVATALATGAFLEKVEWWYGSETQLASAIIQAESGLPVPGYRGVAGMAFSLLDLTQWGNRIPAITCEVLEYGDEEVPNRISSIGYGVQSSEYDRDDSTQILQTGWITGGPSVEGAVAWTAYRRAATTGEIISTSAHLADYLILMSSRFGPIVIQRHRDDVGAVKGNAEQYYYNATFGLSYHFPAVNMPHIAYAVISAYVGGLAATTEQPQGTLVVWGGWLVRPLNDRDAISGSTAFFYPIIEDASVASAYVKAGMYAKYNEDRLGGTLYFFGADDASSPPILRSSTFAFVTGDVYGPLEQANYARLRDPGTNEAQPMPYTIPYVSAAITDHVDTADLGAVGVSGAGWIGMDEVDREVYFYWSNADSKLHRLGDSTAVGWTLGAYDQAWNGAFYVWNDELVYAYNFPSVGLTYDMKQAQLNDDYTTTALGTRTGAVPNPEPGANTYFIPLGHGVYLTETEEWTMSPLLATAGRTLDEVITMICDPVLESADLDVADVATILVRGYWADRRMSRRAAIEPLLPAYGVDAVESDGQLAFRPRGGTASVTVLYADIGAARDAMAAEDAPERLTRERTPVLPQRVDVVYSNVDNAYQLGNQIARRGQELSEEEITLQLPLAMTDAEAAQCAARLLTEGWAGRSRREWSTSLKYARLEPGDVFYAERADGVAVRERIISKREDDGLIEWESVDDDDGVYVQVSDGAPSLDPPSLPLPAPGTFPVVFEVPPLRDIDALAAVLYVAGWTYSDTGWTGAVVFSSDLADTSFAQAGEITVLSLGGTVVDPLPDWDYTSAINVHAGSAFTADIPRDAPDEYSAAQVLAGSGLAWVGGELIRYQTATLVSGNVYRFDGIIRGVLGTDYAAADHYAGEPIVLIPDEDALAAVNRNSSDIGSTSNWRTVTTGKNVPSAPAVAHTFFGATLRPLPPVHLRVGVLADNSLRFAWTRRNRSNQAWLSGVDTPMTETTEQYVLQVIDPADGATLREATVAAATYWDYSAANRFADFGSDEPATITWRVAQVSSIVGNGRWAERTLENPRVYQGTVVALLHFDGSDAATTFTDSTGRHTFSASGNAQLDTAQYKYGTASLLLDGSGDYAQAANSSDFAFGAGDFTIECWVRGNSLTSLRAIAGYANGSASNSNYAWALYLNAGQIQFAVYSGTTAYGAAVGSTLSTGTWYHVALVRSGANLMRFLDGVQQGSPVDVSGVTTNDPASSVCQIGQVQGFYAFDGWIDDLRITKGTAVYLTDFTPPVAAHPDP
jgi:hypothetical protein